MHRRRKILTVIITIILGFSILFSNNTIEAVQNQPDNDFKPVQLNSRPKLLDDLTDSHFTIEGDSDLQTYSSGGTGAPGDPYIISGWRIDARGLPEGIKYMNTWGLHVDFYNNTILGGDDASITVENITANTVSMYGNQLVNATHGIELIDTDEHLINYNIITGCLTGIRFTGDNYEIHNNTFEECDIGIEAETAFQAFIHNNTMINCGYGIFTSGCISSIVNTNNITGSFDVGIYDRLSDSVDIVYNHLFDNMIGIAVNMSTNAILADNRIYNSISDGIFLQESEGTQLWLNHLYFCGFNIYDRNITRAGTLNFFNTNNYVNDRLVHFYHNLDFYGVTGDLGQLIMFNCSTIDLYELLFFDSTYGISLFSCKNFYIFDCEFYNISNGFIFYDVDDIEIDNCIIENGGIGISTQSSVSIYVNNCNISENSNVGIFLYDVVLAEIRDNYFINNTNYGISLEACSDVIIYHNDFIDNGDGFLPQCSDFYGSNNFWYSETLSDGNYWSEYSGIGTYLIHSQFNDIFDLYPYGPIVIPENISVSLFLMVLTITSFLSIIWINRRKN